MKEKEAPNPFMSSPKEFLERFGLATYGQTLISGRHGLISGESAAVSLENPKSAALCFDRIWSLPHEDSDIPASLAFNGGTSAEAVAAIQMRVWQSVGDDLLAADEDQLAAELAQSLKDGTLSRAIGDGIEAMAAKRELVAAFIMLATGGALGKGATSLPALLRGMTRVLAEELASEFECGVASVFPTIQQRDSQYTEGDGAIVVAVLDRLELVDEASLEWKQVLEFREDRESQRRYRRLIHWLDCDLVGKSKHYVEDEIALRFERYQSTIRKHGLKTRLGVLSTLIDPRSLAPAATAASGFLLAGQPLWGLLSSSGLVLGKTMVTLGEARLSFDETLERLDEVAFLSDVYEYFAQGDH